MTAARRRWLGTAQRVLGPVLDHAAAGTLAAAMPHRPDGDRAAYAVLEAVGRTLAGLAPWLEGAGGDAEEAAARERMRARAVAAIAAMVEPGGAGAANFTAGHQPLVDAAFLAQALLRAPAALAAALPAAARDRLVDRLRATRAIVPFRNNWLLFAAMVEAGLARLGDAAWDRVRVEYAIHQHQQWYRGDGVYGDGPEHHEDYYNSFVIHPLLLDVLDAVGDAHPAWSAFRPAALRRAQRHAAVLERRIAPDGSFPATGRSLAYRAGCFHLLAQLALQRRLPAGLPPAQARCALHAVIARTLDAPGTCDAAGWLRPGLCGHQPGLAEVYIDTASLYLTSTAFLPLGLPPEDPFWSDADQPWTSVRIFDLHQDLPADAALKDG